MDREQLKRELASVIKKEEGKQYNTFAVNVGLMARDCLSAIESLESECAEALKKQTPIPVIKLLPRSENDYYDCPACGHYLWSDIPQNYCYTCGQALGWGREAAEKALEEQRENKG